MEGRIDNDDREREDKGLIHATGPLHSLGTEPTASDETVK